eukprot:jgi/Botrbrau1/20522/Bobra.145_2s0075.1
MHGCLSVLNKTSPGRIFFQFRACLQHGTTRLSVRLFELRSKCGCMCVCVPSGPRAFESCSLPALRPVDPPQRVLHADLHNRHNAPVYLISQASQGHRTLLPKVPLTPSPQARQNLPRRLARIVARLGTQLSGASNCTQGSESNVTNQIQLDLVFVFGITAVRGLFQMSANCSATQYGIPILYGLGNLQDFFHSCCHSFMSHIVDGHGLCREF